MRYSIAVGDTNEDIKNKERLFLKNVVDASNFESKKLIKKFEREIKKYYRFKIKIFNKSWNKYIYFINLINT